jgi:hypothetical protein
MLLTPRVNGTAMKAITVRQPFAWLIVSGRKDVENRSWRTHYRGPLLIHAAKKFHEMPLSDIADVFRVRLPPIEDMKCGGIVGICELVDCVDEHRSKWFVGPFGFVLRNAKELPFIEKTGGLGLWNCRRPAGV